MRRFLPGLAVIALIAAATSTVFACAIMPRPERVVRVSGEEVLIIWDAVAQREHLIRYIGFRGDVDDFGFLVPTPSPPEVAEVRGNPFQRVFDIYFRRAPRRRARRGSGPRRPGHMSASRSAPPAVRVLAEHQLAGQTATVLAANDASALNTWLQTHGYPHGEALQQYVTPYVERGWAITAFRYTSSDQRGVRSPSIRLSFDTEHPYFPYAEPPSDSARPPRHFRVSVLARTPMRAGLSRDPGQGRRWRARVGYRGRIGRRSVPLQQAAGAPPEAALNQLTVFDEPRSVRGDADLWFRPHRGASNVGPRLRTAIAPVRQSRRTRRSPQMLDPFQ